MGLINFLNHVNSKVTAWNDSMGRHLRVRKATAALSEAISTERIYVESTLRLAIRSWEREQMLERKGPEYRREFEKAYAQAEALLAEGGERPRHALKLGADYAEPDFTLKIGADDQEIAAHIRARIVQLQEERTETIKTTRHELKLKPGLAECFRREMDSRGLAALWGAEFADID